ncbi:MAG TPA: PQQ-binding-like beta-propeller repeat protein, partial [Planctomycetota bacterium]|nr:PQQ-binding-like beta-propeller repeat protein [Planctomycetota bacterium]
SIAGCDMQCRIIDLQTGEESGTIPLGSNVAASPAYRDGKLYVATMNAGLQCVDTTALDVTWRYEEQGLGSLFASPAVGPWGVIFAARDGTVVCVDATDGRRKWTFSAKGGIDSSPVVVGGRVFFGSADGNVYALGVADGVKQWSFTAGAGVTASPAAGQGRLVIGSEDGAIYCFGAKP